MHSSIINLKDDKENNLKLINHVMCGNRLSCVTIFRPENDIKLHLAVLPLHAVTIAKVTCAVRTIEIIRLKNIVKEKKCLSYVTIIIYVFKRNIYLCNN